MKSSARLFEQGRDIKNTRLLFEQAQRQLKDFNTSLDNGSFDRKAAVGLADLYAQSNKLKERTIPGTNIHLGNYILYMIDYSLNCDEKSPQRREVLKSLLPDPEDKNYSQAVATYRKVFPGSGDSLLNATNIGDSDGYSQIASLNWAQRRLWYGIKSKELINFKEHAATKFLAQRISDDDKSYLSESVRLMNEQLIQAGLETV